MGVPETDVLVVGAGPAGAAAARTAAASGLSVVLVEMRGPPRDKVCGGLLTEACCEQVRRAFGSAVPEDVQVRPSPLPIEVVPPGGAAHAFVVPSAEVLNVDRKRLDAWLDGLAVQAGARLEHDTEFISAERDDRSVTVVLQTPEGSKKIRANWIVGADGVYSRVRAGIAPRPARERAQYIQELYPRGSGLEDRFYLFYRGEVSPLYAYAVPKDERLCLGVGVHRDLAPPFPTAMTRFKAWLVAEFGFHDSPPLSRQGSSVPFGGIAFGRERVLLAGDAAGLCYPPTGEGVTFAIQSGAEAAEAIVRHPEDPAGAYAARMAAVAERIEAAARRTRTLTDAEREERIATKAGI